MPMRPEWPRSRHREAFRPRATAPRWYWPVETQSPRCPRTARRSTVRAAPDSSHAPVLVRVPDLRGRPLADAQRVLTARGLRVGDVTESANHQSLPGSVFAQSPSPDASVAPGTVVQLSVEALAAPRRTVLAPNLAGISLKAAMDTLKALGLRAGRVQYFTLGQYAPGTVYGQSARPNTELAVDTVLNLWVEAKPERDALRSGRQFLAARRLLDLDFDRGAGSAGADLVFDPPAGLRALNGAMLMAAGGYPWYGPKACSAMKASRPVPATEGTQLCVRTNGGHFAMIHVHSADPQGREVEFSFTTWK